MKRIVNIIIITMVVLSMCTINVYAANSASMRIAPSKGEISAGDVVVLTFSTVDVVVEGTNAGIMGISGNFEYDKNVFEPITLEDNFEGLNSWTVRSYNADSGYISATRDAFSTSASNVFSVTLKAKTNATVGSTNIKLKNVTVVFATLTSDPTDYKLATEVLTQVNVKASAAPSPSPSTAPTTTPTTAPTPSTAPSSNPFNNNNNNNNNNNSSQTNNNSNSGSVVINSGNSNSSNNSSSGSSSKLPKAGSEIFIVPAIGIAMIVAIVAYKRYKKMKY